MVFLPFTEDVVLGVGATVGFGTTAYFKYNAKAVFGDGEDLQLYHNATSSYIDNNTGPLYIRNNVDDDDGGNIIIEAKSGKASAVFQDDEGVRLYYDNAEKIRTTNEGVLVSGGTTTGTLSVTGVSTFSKNINANENISVTKNAGIGSLSVAGVSTFTKQLNVGTTIKLGPAGVITATTFKGDVDAELIDVDGRADIDDLIVTGVSTFSNLIDSNLGINVDGGLVADTAKISDLSANRVVYSSSADGELSDSANLTFDGTTLNGTFSGDGTLLSVSIPGVDTGWNF